MMILERRSKTNDKAKTKERGPCDPCVHGTVYRAGAGRTCRKVSAMLKYDDYKERWELREKLLQVIEELGSRNRHCIEPNAAERRRMIFLEKSVDMFLEAVKALDA